MTKQCYLYSVESSGYHPVQNNAFQFQAERMRLSKYRSGFFLFISCQLRVTWTVLSYNIFFSKKLTFEISNILIFIQKSSNFFSYGKLAICYQIWEKNITKRITRVNLILLKPFMHFHARRNCDVDQNWLCHAVDHTWSINTLYPLFLICTCQARYLTVKV